MEANVPELNVPDTPDEDERWLIGETQADLRRMVAYATREASIKIEQPALIDDFVKVTSVSADRLTSDVNLKALLWKTVDLTSQIIRPATAESLRVLSELSEHLPWWRRWGSGLVGRAPTATRSGRRTARRTVITCAIIWLGIVLIVAVAGQAYVSWGLSIGHDIELKRKSIEQIETEIRTADQANPFLRTTVKLDSAAELPARSPSSPDGTAVPGADGSKERARTNQGNDAGRADLNQERAYLELLNKIKAAQESFNALHDAFHYWYLLVARPGVVLGVRQKEDARLFAEAAKMRLDLVDFRTQESKEKREYAESNRNIMDLEWRAYQYRFFVEEHARTLLSILSIHVLPLIFGLLGACVYIVRDLNERIREATLTRNVLTRVPIRRLLGAIFGGLVGLLFSPDTVYGATGLSLVAAAFVVGYSVENTIGLLQALIDNLAHTFGAKVTQPLAPKGKA